MAGETGAALDGDSVLAVIGVGKGWRLGVAMVANALVDIEN